MKNIEERIENEIAGEDKLMERWIDDTMRWYRIIW